MRQLARDWCVMLLENIKYQLKWIKLKKRETSNTMLRDGENVFDHMWRKINDKNDRINEPVNKLLVRTA